MLDIELNLCSPTVCEGKWSPIRENQLYRRTAAMICDIHDNAMSEG